MVEEKLTCGLIECEQEQPQGQLLCHILQLPVDTLRHQVELLSTLSNNHWWPYLDRDGKVPASRSRSYWSHLAWNPTIHSENSIGDFLPSSLRNQIIFFIWHIDCFRDRLLKTVLHVLKQDLSSVSVMDPDVQINQQPTGPKTKRRKVCAREVQHQKQWQRH